MTILGGAIGLVTVFLWLALVATIATINQSDAAGNGMSYAFAYFLAIPLWILLALATLFAATRAGMPGWAKLAALVLLPLSFAATAATINLLANRAAGVSGWPIVVPAAIPPLILAYVLWATVPAARVALEATTTNRVVWGAVLALSLVPWPLQRTRKRAAATTQAERETVSRGMEDAERRALEDALGALGPDAPLRDWLAFATAGHDLRERTLEGIRALPNRQAEAESLRGDDQAMLMSELRNLGLDSTPALCASAGEFLAAHAASFRARATTTTRYEIEGAQLERYLHAMHWLAGRGCDLTRAIDTYDEVVRLFPPASDREQFLTRLASFRTSTS